MDIKVGSQNATPPTGTVIGGQLTVPQQTSADCDGPCNLISGAVTGIDLDDTAPHNLGSPSGQMDILGNYIGLNHDGSAAIGSANPLSAGVNVGDANDIAVGNGNASGQNVISGFAGYGVEAFPNNATPFHNAQNLIVDHNFIGTNWDGTATLGAPTTGVNVDGRSGFDTPNPPIVRNNIISATGQGVWNNLRDQTTIQGNSIGVGTGNQPLTLAIGIELKGDEDPLVDGNTIGNAGQDAIFLTNSASADIVGNIIGPTPALSNSGFGINVNVFLTLGSINNKIGGDTAAEENVISNNDDGGINIAGDASDGNRVLRNTGTGNIGLFIDLGDDGPGATTGANNDIQPPVISSAMPNGISGTGNPGDDVRVFAKASSDPGEIASFVGQATVAGNGTWTVSPGANSPFVAADQTDTSAPDGTSELAIHSVSPDPAVPDTTAPDTTITKKPKKKSKKRKAKFEFASSEAGSTFECALDKKPFAPCSSPLETKKLKAKKHTFKVRATDSAGNTDQSPAQAKFKVTKKKK